MPEGPLHERPLLFASGVNKQEEKWTVWLWL